jgi:hypothetical protein
VRAVSIINGQGTIEPHPNQTQDQDNRNPNGYVLHEDLDGAAGLLECWCGRRLAPSQQSTHMIDMR